MRKSIIVAMDQNNGIGFQNRLPWRLPADFGWFKKLTMAHHIIMGRKTYESIGKPLPGRTTVVVTRNPNFQAKSCFVSHSVSEAFELAESNGESEVFICGGHAIYYEALQSVNLLYVTRVHAEFQVDTSFPYFDESLWVEKSAIFHPPDERHLHPFTFFIYERRLIDVERV